jgi:FlaA1/EpsC-like NDP-sugar epimerase
MRLAGQRLIWIPAAAGGLALASTLAAAWISGERLAWTAAAIVQARVLAALLFRLDRLWWRELTFRDAVTAGMAIGGGSAIAAAAAVLAPGGWPARLLAAELAVHVSLVFGLAASLRLSGLRTAKSAPNAVRAVIWGCGASGRALLENVRRSIPSLDVLGWLDDAPALAEIDRDGAPVLGPLESLPLLVELHGVQAVLVAVPGLDPARRAQAEDLARWSGARLTFIASPTASLEAPASADSAPTNQPMAAELKSRGR